MDPQASEGVSKLFLMRPPQISDVERYLFPVVDYAKKVGVQQIVFLSLVGRPPIAMRQYGEDYAYAWQPTNGADQPDRKPVVTRGQDASPVCAPGWQEEHQNAGPDRR